MAQYKYSDREIKIAEWLGFKYQQSRHYSEDNHWIWPHGGVERFPRTPGGIPHFDNDDGAAIPLLTVIMEKGLLDRVQLDCFRILPDESVVYRVEGWKGYQGCTCYKSATKLSIAGAISAAMVELIDSI